MTEGALDRTNGRSAVDRRRNGQQGSKAVRRICRMRLPYCPVPLLPFRLATADCRLPKIREQRSSPSPRSWIGTPYRHQASLKGVGCDCLGLLDRRVARARRRDAGEAAALHARLGRGEGPRDVRGGAPRRPRRDRSGATRGKATSCSSAGARIFPRSTPASSRRRTGWCMRRRRQGWRRWR